MNPFKQIKRLTLVLLVAVAVVTLAACTGSEKTPYGDLSDENIYLSYDNLKVTEKELYDHLRLQGATVLATMVDDIVFADEIASTKVKLQNNDEGLVEYFNEVLNKAIHGTNDEENLEKLFDEHHDQYVRNIEKFADSLYLLDNSMNIQNVVNDLLGLNEPFANYHTLSYLLNRYALRVAQREIAREILDEDVLDDKHEQYIKDEDIVTYYKNNKQGRYDVDALIVRFINLNEANAALYQVGLKSDSRGFWYAIPDIRLLPGDANYVDLDSPDYGYVKDILDDLGITAKLGVDLEDRQMITVKDFEDYYRAYIINTNRSTGFSDVSLLPDQIKAKLVEIYNLLNPATKLKIEVDGSIVGDGHDYSTTITYDELSKINSSLRTHIYTTLKSADTMADPEDTVDGKPYSSRIQTFGNSRYLVFKLSDDSESEEGILVEHETDNEKDVFATTPEAQAIKTEMKAEMVKAKLTDNYISKQMNEIYDETSLDIYDGIVRLFYEQNYGYKGTTTNRDGAVVAKVGSQEIKVVDFYNKIEASFGINVALDILSNKYLDASDKYSISSADKTDYTQQFENIISQFSANNFEASGYPANLGRQNFLLLAFGSRTNQEAINNLFIYPDLRQQYLDDYELHFGNDEIYTTLATLAERQYNEFESITVSHLLVYFDQNGDDSPDNPQEYLDTLSPAAQIEVIEGLQELMDLVYSRLGMYKGIKEGLQEIAKDFNNSGRIEIGSIVPPFDYTLESIWARYRQLGFHLKFEDITSSITNTSNFVTGSTVLDEVFYNRAMELHDTLSAIEDDDSLFPYLDFYDAWVNTNDVFNENELENVKSSFGYHFILATKVGETTSARFTEDEDPNGKYVLTDLDDLDVYNDDSDTLTAKQVEYFLRGSLLDEGVEVPTDVQTAINNYLNPVLNVYRGTYMQRQIMFNLLDGATLTAPTGAARLNVIKEINVRQLHNYMLSTNGGVFDNNYNALYGDILDVLNGN